MELKRLVNELISRSTETWSETVLPLVSSKKYWTYAKHSLVPASQMRGLRCFSLLDFWSNKTRHSKMSSWTLGSWDGHSFPIFRHEIHPFIEKTTCRLISNSQYYSCSHKIVLLCTCFKLLLWNQLLKKKNCYCYVFRPYHKQILIKSDGRSMSQGRINTFLVHIIIMFGMPYSFPKLVVKFLACLLEYSPLFSSLVGVYIIQLKTFILVFLF